MNAQKTIKVYFISGLAADRRAFQFINLPKGFETVYLDWESFHKGESMQSYALRMGEKIDSTKPFVLIGLSMGGMLATEISKLKTPILTILISSTFKSSSLPKLYRIASFTRIYKLLPGGLYKNASLAKRLFVRESPEVKNIIRQIIRDSNPNIIKAAIYAILSWKNETRPQNMIQIHGTKDELIPCKNQKPDYIIASGSHLMVLSKPEEINRILHKELSGFVV